jgi:DNA-binding NarL/FixJ family response regulator
MNSRVSLRFKGRGLVNFESEFKLYMKTVKILLLDDHQIILDGLKTMLSNEKQFTICGAQLSGMEALKSALIYDPNVIITDMLMPDMSGIDFINNLKSYKVKAKILILSMCMMPHVIQDAIAAGANGYILKQNASRNEIVKAIELVMDDKSYFSEEILTVINEKSKPGNGYHEVSFDNIDISVLSKHEMHVLQLFADGLGNKEISAKLSITTKQVEKFKANIMKKLNLKSNIDLIKFAIKNNICCV